MGDRHYNFKSSVKHKCIRTNEKSDLKAHLCWDKKNEWIQVFSLVNWIYADKGFIYFVFLTSIATNSAIDLVNNKSLLKEDI